MKIYTIGFTQSSAKSFFSRLERAGVRTVLDVRLKADSQLSGFAKKKDLPYLLDKISGIAYEHEMLLAPTQEMLDAYKKKDIGWDDYAVQYLKLLESRCVAKRIAPSVVNESCFLCSEALPHKCHRRLAAEYLIREWDNPIEVVHL